MKKIVIILCLLCFLSGNAAAFLYDIKILSVEEIQDLKDDEIMEVYTEAKIEDRASSEFHSGAGFSSGKDYKKRKSLLRFIINLRREMSTRGLKPDPIEEWLK